MKTVWTNGCFDILHRGHFEMFKFAKSLGTFVIVGIDTDEKVRKSKGDNRPFNCLQDRMFALDSIKYIDEVIPFDSAEELESLIKDLNPEVMVIGSDWKGKKVVGQEYTKELKFFDRIEEYSTTNIIKENKK